MRESSFRKKAREAFDSLSLQDRTDVLYLALLLERDPEVDGVLKYDLPQPPLIFRLLRHMGWRIIYHVPDNATVVIHSIARV